MTHRTSHLITCLPAFVAPLTLGVLLLTSGACGGGSDEPDLMPAQQELVQAANACLRRARCVGTDFANSAAIVECVRSFTSSAGRYGRQGLLPCTEDAGTDCDALLACLNDGQPAADCEQATFALTCEGGVYRGCQDGVEFAVVCPDGTDCQSPGGPHYPCGIAPCDQTATPPMCSEDRTAELHCEQTVLVPTECDASLTCVDGACVGPGPACNTTGGIRCDGNVLTFCEGMKQATRDCAATGHVCGNVEGTPACTGMACGDRGLTASCDAGKLTLCDDGVAYTFECGSDGFGCCGVGLL